MNIKKLREYYDSKEYLVKLQKRVETVRLCAEDPVARARMVLEVYSTSFERFCEDFLFVIMPEFGDAIKPFFLFEYQKEIVQKIQEAEQSGEDMELLVDKPRGMGITWIIVAYFYWRWLFTPNWTAFILSRTETEVDDGTDTPGNSIFAKFRWCIKKTPKWLLPQGFESKGKKGNSTDSTLRIINPQIGSALIGSSTNSNAGRSRRYSITFIDECFSIERFSEVYRALQSVSRVKLFVSTTKAGTVFRKFKDMCELAGNYISLTWRDHPFKDQEWYEEQLRKAEFDPEVMKEVDVSYAISKRSQYYPQIEEARIALVDYQPGIPVFTGLDFGRNDLTVIIWAQFVGSAIHIIECYANKEKPALWYAPFLNKDIPLEFAYSPYQEKVLQRVRAWQNPKANFGEVAHTQKSMSDNKSISDVLGKVGVRIMVNNYAIEHEPRRHATSSLLPRMVFNENSEGVMRLYDAIMNSRYKNSGATKTTAMQPVHDDEISDHRSALENLCVNFGRIFKSQRSTVGEEFRKDGFAQKLITYLKV